MTSRLRVLACVVAGATAVAVAGCDFRETGGQRDTVLPEAATRSGGNEVWDLRVRPDAGAVGIDDGDTAVFETRPPRPAVFRLAGGAELRLSARYVAFSSIGSTDGSPVGVDVKTGTMPLDATVEAYRAVLDQLDLPTAKVAAFEKAATSATGTEWVRSDREAARFGDLDLGVVARYSPHAGTGVVAVIGGWPAGR